MKNWKQGSGARNEKKKLERIKKRESRKRDSSPPKLSRKIAERLEEAQDLIESREYDAAIALLARLDKPGSVCNAVLELLIYLYQLTRQHANCSEVAERLMQVKPRDPIAHIAFAQSSMYCGRVAIAMNGYQEFVECWPEHEYAIKARNALEVLVPEVERKIKALGFPKEHAVAWTVIHEQALAFLQRGDLVSSAAKCERLLALKPDFAPARNNLASTYFHTGRELDAVTIAEATRKLAPSSRFAEASLARLYFLTGREQDAQEIANQLVKAPPTDPDSMTVTLETLAYLGRDEDIVALGTEAVRIKEIDNLSLGMQLHYLAYAKCRLGDIKGAKTLWNKCLAYCPDHSQARENLLDLKTGGGHSPWAESFNKWIPKSQADKIVNRIKSIDNSQLVSQIPAFSVLIPAILDRGDPAGREIMTKLAMIDPSPQMIEALKKFAFSSRGPDKLRFEVLSFLQKGNYAEAGAHRFYSNGKLTDVMIFSAEITSDHENLNYSEEVRELLDAGSAAHKKEDFDLAETIYQEVLALDPSNSTAIYNLCITWLNRDGASGKAKATQRLMKLREESPGYVLVPISLAQLAARDGDFTTAHRLLKSVFDQRKLRMTEAVSLFAAQVDIAILEKKPDAAQVAFNVLLEFADPDDPRLEGLARRIDLAKSKNPLRKLLSRW